MSTLEQDLAEAGLPPLANAKQLAAALGVTLNVIYSMNDQGMPRVRAGATLRYSRKEVAAYLETFRKGTVPAVAAVGQ